MADVDYGSLPFEEAIEFFKDKLNIPTEKWNDLWKQQHDVAFMVAGAMKADLLMDLRLAMEKAIKEGTTLEQFRKDFDKTVEKNGWNYTGGRNWRTAIIYDTNMRQSYNAGRERQMANPALRKRRPYGLYVHGDSRVPREEHLAWHNKVVPLDDPWWDTHSPANGWNCSCKKFMLSDADVERRGLVVESGQDMPFGGRYRWADNNLRLHAIPNGIDPGFDYTPGVNDVEKTREQVIQKAKNLPTPLSKYLMSDIGE